MTATPLDALRRRRMLTRAAAVLAGAVATSQPLRALATSDLARPADPFDGVRLVDQDGRAFKAGALRGKPLLLQFVYTTCGRTCPTQTTDLVQVRGRIERHGLGDRIRFLSVSVDPLTDTPATLKRFAAARDADRPGWTFATGTPQSIETLVDRIVGTAPKAPGSAIAKSRSPEEHSTVVRLYGPDLSMVQSYAAVPVNVDRLEREIVDYLAYESSVAQARR